MGNFVRAAAVSEVQEGQSKLVEINGRQIALFKIDGAFYAIDNICKHRGGPLHEGEIDGKCVLCPWHGWAYDVTSGECLEDSECNVDRFDLKVEGDELLIAI